MHQQLFIQLSVQLHHSLSHPVVMHLFANILEGNDKCEHLIVLVVVLTLQHIVTDADPMFRVVLAEARHCQRKCSETVYDKQQPYHE